MELTGELETAFNKQVTLEMQASIVYRQLAIDMDVIDLPGIAQWLRAQSEEEIIHCEKFVKHMTDRDAHPTFEAIPAVSSRANTVLEAFEAALAHEKKVSEAIRELYRTAQSAADVDSLPMLYWFISEQVEEESTISEIVGRVKLISDDGPGLLRLDAELGQRVAQVQPAEA
ncbi:ferritin [Neomicrococcus aestuarii]|uniref:Ferritin n=1 Tax=Neomicrococcus aestuarii TaxID=556325 RepID=A0A1L2ZQ08_9MICC|nr:ferritin [Neomicrococcus aestuarii]APF41270.1 ferritin [Neomicrococcus aestuarii]MBB5513179.1 ferritin [Neomicrococcus aestuarii]